MNTEHTKHTFSYHDEESLGKLYVQGEVLTDSETRQSYLLNLTAAAIRREYYKNPNAQPLQALTESLQKANIILDNFKEKTNFICGVLCNGKLYLAETKDGKFGIINQTPVSQVPNTNKKRKSLPNDLPIIRPSIRKKRLMPVFTKFTLAIYIIFSIFIAKSAYSIEGINKKIQQAEKQKIISQAKLNLKQAQASLILGETNKAKGLLQQAKNIALKIKNKDAKTKLSKDINNELNKLKTMSSTDIILPFHTNTIGMSNHTFYIFNNKDKNIYSIDEKSKTLHKIAEIKDKNIKQQIRMRNDESLVLLAQDINQKQMLVILDTQTNSIQIPDKPNMPNAFIKNIGSYDKYIYMLTNNQIYKAQRTLIGFGKPAQWLKNKNTELNTAISMSIDGSVYILTKTGKIMRFFKGVQQNFALDNTKIVQMPIKILASSNTNLIYLLCKNKVLAFDKTGKLKKQYTDTKFTDLKDIAINEKDGAMYLLNRNIIFKIKL